MSQLKNESAVRLLDGISGWMKAGGAGRKAIVIYGAILGGLLLLSLPVMIFTSLNSGPEANRANFDKVQIGMNEQQVQDVMGRESRSEKRQDGSMQKTWDPTASNNGPMCVTFVNGAVASKLHDIRVANAASAAGPADPSGGSFFDRHSGQWTVTIAFPKGDMKLRFDVSKDSAQNLKMDANGEWIDGNGSSPVQVSKVRASNADEAIVTVAIHGDNYPMGVRVNGNQITGSLEDGEKHLFAVTGDVQK